MNFSNILELFDFISNGQSVVLNSIVATTINGAVSERAHKLWQIEKVSEHEYCFKKFDGYDRAIKHFFFIDTSRANIEIEEYCSDFRKAFNEMMCNIYGDEEILSKIVSKDLLKHRGFDLNYTDLEFLERDGKYNSAYSNKLYSYKFTSFKTKQLRDGSNKSGENAIREVLNKYIELKHPNGVRQDEYMTIGSKSRADSVVFHEDHIHVYEIKSEKDAFTRLESQIEDYRQYAERITIVLDVSKYSAYVKNHQHKFKGVEVLIYDANKTELALVKKGSKLIPTSNKMGLLWKDELYAGALCYTKGTRSLSQFLLVSLASEVFSKPLAIDLANKLLYDRASIKETRVFAEISNIYQRHNIDAQKIQQKADKFLEKHKEPKRKKPIPLLERIKAAGLKDKNI